MNFIELKRKDGNRFLYDFDSHWEICDRGDQAAFWVNDHQGRNFHAVDTYESLRARLALTNPMLTTTVG